MHQIEHSRRMGADFQVLKGQFEELFNMSILQSQANQIKSHHKRPMRSNQNKMVFFHRILLNKKEREIFGNVVDFIKKNCIYPFQCTTSNPNLN
jgi:hypothetical protein